MLEGLVLACFHTYKGMPNVTTYPRCEPFLCFFYSFSLYIYSSTYIGWRADVKVNNEGYLPNWPDVGSGDLSSTLILQQQCSRCGGWVVGWVGCCGLCILVLKICEPSTAPYRRVRTYIQHTIHCIHIHCTTTDTFTETDWLLCYAASGLEM